MLILYGTTVSFRGGPKGPSPEPMNTTLNRGGTVRCALFSDVVFMGSGLLADARPRNDRRDSIQTQHTPDFAGA
ncbi:hypothetical protein CHELA40_13734 [Chelatococcus asaccharovorans]|nr:hypothetical protein CHELA40_13734 [Chelatococcus asaccharovorans]CAH1675997.1 hypothetical protein CHELA17_61891 [Chelatococcus asaccharovorans]